MGPLLVPILASIALTAPAAPRISYTNIVKSQNDFRALARQYRSGNRKDLPHVLLIVDRKQKKTYHADSKNFDFHESFSRSLGLEKGSTSREFFRRNYTASDRPLILATLVQGTEAPPRYFLEFAEADQLGPELVAEAYSAVRASFGVR